MSAARLGLCLLLAALVSCSRPSPPLPHDAYVWQRVWTPVVGAAVGEAAPSVRAWRVLAAELDGQGRWNPSGADRRALAATGKPVVLVFRIEGQLVRWDEAALRRAVLAMLADWRRGGAAIAAVEVDHDCGTARLPAYAAFLATLRAALPANVALSLTALPAWLGSPALKEVLAVADEAVLQVHAVADPRSGLFDAARARRWMEAFGKEAGKPWRVALPAYGSKVVWDEAGRIAAVDSERPSLVAGQGAAELMANPADMAAFLAALHADRPDGLAGIAWFRLPTADDRRAWSLATFLAVVKRQPIEPLVTATARPAGEPGLYDIVLAGSGTADAGLPAQVRVNGRCMAADGINFYTVERDASGLALSRMRGGLLRPGAERVIGWARCEGGAPVLRLE